MGNTNETGRVKRIQWHDAFVAAMKLELKEYAYGIEFHPEYELTGRPKYIDLLMIRQAEKLVELEGKASTDWEHDNVEEVMDVAIAANREVFEHIRGGSDMCKAMWELMKPEIDAYVAEKDKRLAQKDKKIAQKDKKIAQKDKKIAEQEQEIERLNKIIPELSYS